MPLGVDWFPPSLIIETDLLLPGPHARLTVCVRFLIGLSGELCFERLFTLMDFVTDLLRAGVLNRLGVSFSGWSLFLVTGAFGVLLGARDLRALLLGVRVT